MDNIFKQAISDWLYRNSDIEYNDNSEATAETLEAIKAYMLSTTSHIPEDDEQALDDNLNLILSLTEEI